MALPVNVSGALLPLDAPLPQPRRYTLLDAAQLVTPADERWLAGAWINGYPSARALTAYSSSRLPIVTSTPESRRLSAAARPRLP